MIRGQNGATATMVAVGAVEQMRRRKRTEKIDRIVMEIAASNGRFPGQLQPAPGFDSVEGRLENVQREQERQHGDVNAGWRDPAAATARPRSCADYVARGGRSRVSRPAPKGGGDTTASDGDCVRPARDAGPRCGMRLSLILIVCLVAAGSARAEGFVGGNHLLGFCRSDHGLCFGYVMDVFEALGRSGGGGTLAAWRACPACRRHWHADHRHHYHHHDDASVR